MHRSASLPRKVWAAVVSVLLVGCTAFCRADPPSPCAQEGLRSRQTAQQIEQQWPLRGSDAVSQSVRALGERLGRVTDYGSTWHISVVRDHSVNAFAIGDGRVYITDGAIRFADSEHELAAILAHEMGHQLAGHFCVAEPDAAVSWNPLEWFSRRAVGEVRQRQVGTLTQVIDPIKEREADRYAARILEKTGYDPHAMLDVAERLSAVEPYSHLNDRRRVGALRALLAETASKPREPTAEFLRLKGILSATAP